MAAPPHTLFAPRIHFLPFQWCSLYNFDISVYEYWHLDAAARLSELLQNPYYEQIKRKQSSGCRESRLKDEIIEEI